MNSHGNFRADEMMSTVDSIVNFGCRRAGTEGGLALEKDLARRLREFGFESVRLEPMEVEVWNADVTCLQIYDAAGTPVLAPDAQAVPYVAFTPENNEPRRLIFAKSTKDLKNCKGAIVVADIGFPALNTKLLLGIAIDKNDPDNSLPLVNHPATWVRLGWHLYREAERRGAAGFVGILKDQPGGTCHMYGPYGFREQDILDKRIPAVWVGRSQGVELKRIIEDNAGRASAKLTLSGTRYKGVTHNVIAELPGSSLDNEVTVLSCHHDSPFESPVEDATGNSVVLALAERFAKERTLRRRLVVLFSAGHFYGSIGTRDFIHRHRADITACTALEISIEHVALEAIEGPDGTLVPTGRPEPTAMFVSFSKAIAEALAGASRRRSLDRTILLPAEGPLGNYPPTDGGDWFEAGVPVINCISNPVYLLTDEDHRKWVDQARLPKVAEVFHDTITQLDKVSRKDLAKTKSWPFRLVMKGLRWITSAISTRFWTRRFY